MAVWLELCENVKLVRVIGDTILTFLFLILKHLPVLLSVFNVVPQFISTLPTFLSQFAWVTLVIFKVSFFSFSLKSFTLKQEFLNALLLFNTRHRLRINDRLLTQVLWTLFFEFALLWMVFKSWQDHQLQLSRSTDEVICRITPKQNLKQSVNTPYSNFQETKDLSSDLNWKFVVKIKVYWSMGIDTVLYSMILTFW